MIQVSKEETFFSLPLKGVLLSQAGVIDSLRRPLVFAHVCSHCDVLVQALLECDKPIEDELQEYFKLEEPPAVGKLAATTENHSIQPRYLSKFITLPDGRSGNLLMEEFHFNICETSYSGRCNYTEAIFRLAPDPVYCAARLLNIETKAGWHEIHREVLPNFRKGLKGPHGKHLAEQLMEMSKSRILTVPDVTGKYPPAYLMSRNEWGYGTLEGYLRDILKEPLI